MTYLDLLTYVGAGDEDTLFAQHCWEEAESLVGAFVGEQVVPEVIVDRATLEVGSELFQRRKAPNGISQLASFNGVGIRVARDPMVGAYPLLRRYMVVL